MDITTLIRTPISPPPCVLRLLVTLLSTTLMLAPKANADDDCHGGFENDPAHFAQMEEENFGRNWVLQLPVGTVEDLMESTMATESVRSYLVWEGTHAILPGLDVEYRYRVTATELILESDRLVIVADVAADGRIGSYPCSDVGSLTISGEPEIEDNGSVHSFATDDVQVDLDDFPVLCGLGPGSSWFTTISVLIEYQAGLMLSREWFDIEDAVGLDADTLEAIDSTLGGADPYADMVLSVVEEETWAGEPFVMLGGNLVTTPPCESVDYPLFAEDEFWNFTTFLGQHSAALAISMRVVPVLRTQMTNQLPILIDQVLDRSLTEAGYGWVDADFHDLTVWYSGLKANSTPCDCFTGDTEHWFDLDQADPRVGFRSFFLVEARAFDILGWNPGPIILQINGVLDFIGNTVQLDLTRANAYGPWWTDSACWVVKTFWGIDLQSASFYEEQIGDLDFGWLPSSVELPMATLDLCSETSALFSAQVFHWHAGPSACEADTDGDGEWDSDATDSDLDGLSDEDEVLFGTDPFDPDTDDDSLRDGLEVILGCDPVSADGDGDGAEDWSEAIRMATDCMDWDTDDDGASDHCEEELGLTDPLDPDTDGDGILDGSENLVTLGCP